MGDAASLVYAGSKLCPYMVDNGVQRRMGWLRALVDLDVLDFPVCAVTDERSSTI